MHFVQFSFFFNSFLIVLHFSSYHIFYTSQHFSYIPFFVVLYSAMSLSCNGSFFFNHLHNLHNFVSHPFWSSWASDHSSMTSSSVLFNAVFHLFHSASVLPLLTSADISNSVMYSRHFFANVFAFSFLFSGPKSIIFFLSFLSRCTLILFYTVQPI